MLLGEFGIGEAHHKCHEERVRNNIEPLKQMCLNHGFWAHEPFVHHKKESQSGKCYEAANHPGTAPRMWSRVVHSKDEAGD